VISERIKSPLTLRDSYVIIFLKGKIMTNKIQWEITNWDKQDIIIATEKGCSREAVRQARIRCGGKPALFPRLHRKESAADRLSKIDTTDKTLPELVKIAKCNTSRAMYVLKSLGKTYTRRPRGNPIYDWTLFPADWEDKTDKEIAVLVGTDNPAIVTQWRHRHGYRKQVCSIVQDNV